MKKLLLITVIFILGCTGLQTDNVEGNWVKPGGYRYFGSAIELKNGKVRYWMYTDKITDDYLNRKFPEQGTYKVKGNEVYITINDTLWETVFYLIEINGEKYLSTSNVSKDMDVKWLWHNYSAFNEKKPFEYQDIFYIKESGI